MPTPTSATFPVSDLSLSRRLERAEAHANAGFVDARVKVDPASSARRIEVAGAYAMFDTPTSPMTQSFGLGLDAKVSEEDLDRIEHFFQERGAPVLHEISPLADLALLSLLNQREYRPVEFTSVLYRPIVATRSPTATRNDRIQVRQVADGEHELWAEVSVRGWNPSPEIADFLRDIGRLHRHMPEVFSFLAQLDGQPIATAALCLWEGVALLAGASTVPQARRQGAQLALTACRLQYAAEKGCDLAMICAEPGGVSQRNAERNGFRIAYTRVKWRLEQGEGRGNGDATRVAG